MFSDQEAEAFHRERRVKGWPRARKEALIKGDWEWTRLAPSLAYYVYMLRCSDGSYYVGHTNDLEHRLAAHERGAIEGYTLSRRPVELVFSDQFSTRLEAFHRERHRSLGDGPG